MSSISADAKARRAYEEASQCVVNRLKEIQKLHDDPLIKECYRVAVGQHEYVDNCAFPESDLQIKVRVASETDKTTSKGLGMMSSQLQGNFLKMFAEMVQAKHCLEIGMFTGYGTVNLAEAAFCETVTTLDIDPYYETFVKKTLAGSPIENKVRIMIAPALDSLVKLKEEGKVFDFVFIDANKEGYISYYKYIMDNNMLSPTGCIACDNVLWYGATFDQTGAIGKALHEFAEFVKKDERVNQMLLPISDGILLITRKHLNV